MFMKQILLSNKQLKMSIGPYKIGILHLAVDPLTYYLPVSTEQFLDNNEIHMQVLDISYVIQLEDSFREPEDVPVTGLDEGPSPYRIYRVGSGDYLWIRKKSNRQIKLVYRISENWSVWTLLVDNSGSQGTHSFAELAYIFAYSILNKGGILFHGVVMEWMGMGIIVCAHSGVGKTTHTRMWRDTENALILNGDRALCCKQENKWYAYGAPWSGSSQEYRNCKTPLVAVVILEQEEENQVSILSPLQGALELIGLTFAPIWEERLLNCSLDTIDNIVQSIPVFKLKCKPELESVKVLKVELEKLMNSSKRNV